jgi:N-acylglucosamine-6-phosphate 2-epimerase
MSGYTPDSVKQEGPDFELLADMVGLRAAPVFAEGRIWTREEVRQAIDTGASFVVVGTAITNPTAITARMVAAIR